MMHFHSKLYTSVSYLIFSYSFFIYVNKFCIFIGDFVFLLWMGKIQDPKHNIYVVIF